MNVKKDILRGLPIILLVAGAIALLAYLCATYAIVNYIFASLMVISMSIAVFWFFGEVVKDELSFESKWNKVPSIIIGFLIFLSIAIFICLIVFIIQYPISRYILLGLMGLTFIIFFSWVIGAVKNDADVDKDDVDGIK